MKTWIDATIQIDGIPKMKNGFVPKERIRSYVSTYRRKVQGALMPLDQIICLFEMDGYRSHRLMAQCKGKRGELWYHFIIHYNVKHFKGL